MIVEKEIAAYMPAFNMAAGYLDCVAIIKENFQNMAENVVAIGYYLKHIRDQELYKDGSYKSFGEFAKEEFGLSPTSTSRYMSINDRFSIDGNSPYLMEDKKGFSKSQLQEMLYLSDDQLETVTPDMTVKQIRGLAASQEVEIECQTDDEENIQIPGQLDIEFYPEVLPKGYQDAEEKQVQAETVEEQYAAKQEKLEVNEDNLIRAFYEHLYDSKKDIIRQRQNAEIIKLFKKEYGQTYAVHGKPGGISWSCYPDKICFTFSGIAEPLQITWGKFTTKLLRILDAHPEIESGTSNDEPEDQDELLCDDCANASALTGNVDLCANCGSNGRYYKELAGEDPEQGEVIIDADFRELDEEPEQKLSTDPVEQSADDENKYYNSIAFIRKVLDKEHQNLRYLKDNEKSYGREVIEETKVIIAALANMICELERMELKEKLAELEKEEK